MADFTGKLILKGDIEDDELQISGEKDSLAVILALVNKDIIIKPQISNSKDLIKYMKRPPAKIVLKIGSNLVKKSTFIEMLSLLGIKKWK